MSSPPGDDSVSLPWPGDSQRPLTVSGSARPARQGAWSRQVARPRSVDGVAKRQDDEFLPRERSELLARGLNIFVAAASLLVALPVLVLVVVAIKLTSPGPVLYSQTRVGLDRRWRRALAMRDFRDEDLGGQVFTMYKFRTMRTDAERGSGAVWAVENDPRVTPIGKFLRKYRIDEIPQLWNVIAGDMNIVGPRPERPSIVARLRRDIPNYRYRHRVRPGLTGLAQINQRYDSSLDDVRNKVAWDLRYIREQGFWLDVRIMLRTVPAVLLKFRGW